MYNKVQIATLNKYKSSSVDQMGIKIGGLDPIKLSDGILQALEQKGIFTKTEIEQIISYAKS